MSNEIPDYKAELENLYKTEFNDPYEPYVRSIGVAVAGILIYVYSNNPLSLFWCLWFIASMTIYYVFMKATIKRPKRSSVVTVAVLMANGDIAFSWFPLLLVVGESRALMFVGAVLICTQLIFLTRRNDALPSWNLSHFLVVLAMSVVAYIGFMPAFDTPLAHIGAALAVLALNFYFGQSLALARRIRRDREEAQRDRENAISKAHQSQKMAAVGQLAGGVAHDFNNNLTAIIGGLELLELSVESPDQRADIQISLAAAQQAAKTIKHLMIFARIEKPTVENVELAGLFDELEVLVQRLIPVSVTLSVRIAEPDLSAKTDRQQLIAALINLLVNAVDAMPMGGRIEIDARETTVARSKLLAAGTRVEPGRYVRIGVQDTGEGIPPEIQDRVCEPFFTTKPVGKGTGLGLSMVAGMLQELNGALDLWSDPSGTKVWLYLPSQPTDTGAMT